MKKVARWCFALAIVLAVAFSGSVQAEDWEGNANFLLGWKWLDGDDWGNYDSQDEFAAMISFGRSDWPVHVAIDFVRTWDEGTWWDWLPQASTAELDIGVRKVWERGKARPFVGGGVALIFGEFDTFDGDWWISRNDLGVGIWLDGGLFWRLKKSFNIGFEVRFSTADATIDGTDVDAGGAHLGLVLGYGW